MPNLTTALIDLAGAGDDALVLGTVKAIDVVTNSLTVTLPAGDVSGLRWITSYTPTLDDLVVVERVSGSWIVQGKTSAVLTAQSIRDWSVPPSTWTGSKSGPTGSWSWSGHGCAQGYWSNTDFYYAGYALATGFTSAVPAGAVVKTAKISVSRLQRLDSSPGSDGPPLVSPVIYGTTVSTPSGTPSLAAGFGPWRPGSLTYGQTGTWDIPSSWLSALFAGTLTGIAFYSTQATDFAWWINVSLSGTYTY